jgi:hypothetical protein
MASKSVPKDKVNLKLIFVAANDQAGKEFQISPNLTGTCSRCKIQDTNSSFSNFSFFASHLAIEISHFVFENWPQEWTPNKVNRPEVLKLIYQGRFLHENVSLNCKCLSSFYHFKSFQPRFLKQSNG